MPWCYTASGHLLAASQQAGPMGLLEQLHPPAAMRLCRLQTAALSMAAGALAVDPLPQHLRLAFPFHPRALRLVLPALARLRCLAAPVMVVVPCLHSDRLLLQSQVEAVFMGSLEREKLHTAATAMATMTMLMKTTSLCRRRCMAGHHRFLHR